MSLNQGRRLVPGLEAEEEQLDQTVGRKQACQGRLGHDPMRPRPDNGKESGQEQERKH